MGCQKDIAQVITDQDADYVLALKHNHGTLYEDDACRIRKDQGAQTFSVLRHIALNLLRQESSHKRGSQMSLP